MTTVITPQKQYPCIFDIPTVMQYLKLDDITDSNIISIIIDYAISYATKTTNTLISKDIYDINFFEIKNNTISLNFCPITTINRISVNNVELIKGVDYTINNNLIVFTTPTISCNINVLGGYNALNLLPPELRIAILMHISSSYDNRNGLYQAVPNAVNNIYNKIGKCRISFNK